MDLQAKTLIRDVPDFPKPGIIFKDITPVLQSPEAFRQVESEMIATTQQFGATSVLGIESRGFIFAAPIATALNLPLILARKLGKLPYKTMIQEYSLEYGTATIEMHEDSVNPGDKVVIVDDLIATGGTALASAQLVEKLGGTVAGFCFLVELSFLPGRELLRNYPVKSLIKY